MKEVPSPISLAPKLADRNSFWDVYSVFILPWVCFAADFEFGGFVAGTYPGAVWTFALTGSAAFLWSSYMSPGHRAAPFVAALLSTAALGAFAIGVFLLPFALIAILFAGLGLLGLVPFLTGWRLLKRSRLLFKRAPVSSRGAVALGAAVAIIPAMAVFTAERLGDERRRADLTSNDPQRVMQVLRKTRFYSIRDLVESSIVYGLAGPSPLQAEVCEALERIPTGIAEINRTVRDILRAGNDSLEVACYGLLAD